MLMCSPWNQDLTYYLRLLLEQWPLFQGFQGEMALRKESFMSQDDGIILFGARAKFHLVCHTLIH